MAKDNNVTDYVSVHSTMMVPPTSTVLLDKYILDTTESFIISYKGQYNDPIISEKIDEFIEKICLDFKPHISISKNGALNLWSMLEGYQGTENFIENMIYEWLGHIKMTCLGGNDTEIAGIIKSLAVSYCVQPPTRYLRDSTRDDPRETIFTTVSDFIETAENCHWTLFFIYIYKLNYKRDMNQNQINRNIVQDLPVNIKPKG